MTKLYLIEGLPCSGKSTTSRYVARKLAERGHTVQYFDEGTGNHPADYEFHSYLDLSAMKSLSDELQRKVTSQGAQREDGCIVPLSSFSGEELDALLPFKLYDALPWETEKPRMLERWQEFAENAQKEDCIYVFNCVFLQNPMCETMMRFDFFPEGSFSYISEIYEIIRPLKPRVIYLQNDHIAAAIRQAAQEREGWLSGVIDYHVNGAYGKRMGAQGFEGYISCLEERQRRELDFLKHLGIPSLILRNPQFNWQLSYAAIENDIEHG